jgi:hypothetical protein
LWSRRLWRQKVGIPSTRSFSGFWTTSATPLRARGTQILLGPPESQGSGGAVP